MDALPEERYWQTRHQQARVKMGNLSNSNRMAPHKHPPVIVTVTDLPLFARIADRFRLA